MDGVDEKLVWTNYIEYIILLDSENPLYSQRFFVYLSVRE